MPDRDDLPTLRFESAEAFEAWLRDHHEEPAGLWLQIAKKASGIPSVSHPEALEVALCYGWIDGQRLALDDSFFLQRFTPRRARSPWSKRNRDIVAKLTEAGRMQPAGLREVERAKADGRWDAAYDPHSTASVPHDFQEALDAEPKAKQFFATLSGTKRYAFLYRIQTAKKPETRERRIRHFVEVLAQGRTLHD